ncbi:obscurin isoform X4 [Harmonia axyridis]|uniref:obscurin isoform X4 n=1 Tax=Harmonia axyridis TaxID=115357 RepID=UPI001E2790EC|nr:obscurin isoform X4 [Harmonia axyridis]
MATTKSSMKEVGGELLVAWQKYTAIDDEELTLKAGDVVELIETNDPQAKKKLKLDPELEVGSTDTLDASSARHKLSVRPRRKHTSSRYSPTRLNVNARWLVREVSGNRREGWVPCQVLQTIDDPVPGTGLPGDAAFRRQAVVKELVETEQEFVRDLDFVVHNYLFRSESKKVPKIVRDNFEVIFGNLKEIAEFHRTVLMEGVRYYENEPHLLGKAYLRLERDFDKHVNYCRDEPQAQIFLENCTEAREYFEGLSQRLGDDKSLSEHLKLPIQRINDYQLLLKELVRYSACLGEDNTNLQKALELMLSIPSRAEDDKFTSSIEGYRGSIHKLGRLLGHDWFSITIGNLVKERYLFLFKGRILICKVRRISDDRSVFQLKDVVKLHQIEIKDHPEKESIFELVDKATQKSVLLTTHREGVKENWLKEIRQFAKDHGTEEESGEVSPDEFRLSSPTTESTLTPEVSKTVSTVSRTQEIHQTSVEESRKVHQKEESTKPIKTIVEAQREVGVTESKKKVELVEKQATQKSTYSEVKVELEATAEEKHVQKKSIIVKKSAQTKESQSKQVEKSGEKRIENSEGDISLSGKRGIVEDFAQLKEEISEQETKKKRVKSQKQPEQPTREKSPEHPQSPYPPHDDHLKRIEEVEPLIEINKPRFVEEVIPHNLPLYRAPSGSALAKLCSVQPVHVSDHVIADYSVGVEVNVEYGDEMSRRYTSSSSSRAEALESSYSSRRSLTSDGYSSKYSSDLSSSKYGTARDGSLTGGSKYEDISSKYSSKSRLERDEGDSLSRHSRRSLAAGDEDYGFSRRSIKSKTSSLDRGDDDSYSYSRKIKSYGDTEGDGNSYTYSRKSVIAESTVGVSDGNSYTKKRIVTAAEAINDGDSISIRKATRTYVEGDGSDVSSARSRREKLAIDNKNEEDYVSKYTRRSTSIRDEDEDVYSKYAKKYSRTDSVDRKTDLEDDIYSKYSSKYSRSTSRQKDDKELEEDDSYSKYTKRYSRTNSKQSDDYSFSRKEENEEDVYAKYSRKYSRSDSKNRDEELEYSRKYSRTKSREEDSTGGKYSRQSSRKKSIENNGEDDAYSRYKNKYLRSESTESSTGIKRQISSSSDKQEDEIRTETKTQINEISSASKTEINKNVEVKEEIKAQQMKVESSLVSEKVSIQGSTEVQESSVSTKHTQEADSISLTMKTTKEESGKTASEKVNELEDEDDGKPRFVKTMRGANIELTPEERADRMKNDHPEFLVALKDTELLENTYLRFMVKIAGEPNPEIAFFKDGLKILDNTEPYQIIRDHSDVGFYELVIPEVKQKDAGVYKCVATNKYGEACSEATVVVTEDKQVFEDMPEGETLPPGEKPEFLWKKDGEPFEPEERFKVLMGDDEDSLALVFQHVRPEDVGLYTCVAQTSRGHISCSAELTVHGTINQIFREPEKPKLVIEKRDPIVTAGGSAMLELQVKGYPKPNVKFTHNNKTIEAGSKYKILYEDEESISLVIKDVQSEDAGKYTIVAENELGSDVGEMSLTVKAPPKITKKIENTSVHADEVLKLTMTIEGVPKPTVKYLKNGKEIKKSERVKFVEEGDKYSLVIQKTSIKDTGSYSVVAMNEMAQVSEFWELDVFSKPKIIQGLEKSKIVSQGENVDFVIKCESKPKAEVKWFKDDVEIKSDSHYTIKEEGDSYILKISGAVTTDAAKYKFKAMNIHGTVEDEVKVDVKKGPKITKPLNNMTVTEGDCDVTFDVKLEAFPKPKVKWYLDEMELTETKSEFTSIEYDDGVKLVIKEVSSSLTGKYTCKLSNECGEAETSAKLTVNCAPRIIKQLKDTTVEEGATLHLELEIEACPAPQVKWLRNGREVNADARIKISRDSKRNETYNLDVSLIKYEEQGEYEVYVTNELGTVSSKSLVTVHKVTHTDAIEETGEEPKKLKIEIVEDDSQKVQIQEVSDDEEKGPVKNKHMTMQETLTVTLNPLVEEPNTPVIESPGSANAEYAQYDIKYDQNAEPAEETFTLPKKPRRTSSVTIEEIDVTENILIEEKEVEEVNLPQPRHALSSTKEEVFIEELNEMKTEMKQEENIDEKDKRKIGRSISAPVENVEKKEVANTPLTPVGDELPVSLKSKIVRKESLKVMIPEIPEVDSAEEILMTPGTPSKAVIIGSVESKSEELEKIPANKESSKIIEIPKKLRVETSTESEDIAEHDLADKIGKSKEVAPSVLTTNMKDGSRPESLGITYIVRGFANPPPTAKWMHNDKEITPESHLRMKVSQEGEEFKLEIKKLKMEDAGTYSCILSNILGQAAQNAVLEVTPEKELRRPKISQGLVDQTIVKKHSVTHKIVVIADPIPDITWYFNGEQMNIDDYEKHNIILETEDHEIQDGLKECTFSLTIPRCERSNQGNYRVKAKNVWSEAESSAELTIILRPEIEGPDDVSVVPGEATQFKVVIQSNPVPEVTWSKDDHIIEASDLVEIVEDVANETYKLIFKKVLLSDGGYYKVTAKNKLGETTSEARLKTIKDTEPTTEKPKFITVLQEDNVSDGGEVELMVRADGLPKPEIKWFFNAKPLIEDENHKIETHTETQVTSCLRIKNYNKDDIGFYKAMAVNCVGEVESSAKIAMIQTPPNFSKKLDRTHEINEGQNLELKAKVSGSPKPTVVWYKNGEPITDERVKTVLLPDGTAKLNIDDVTPEDSGAYKLVIKNQNGDTSCLCAVAVQPTPKRPKFKKVFKDVDLATGETLRLEAQVIAYPPPEIKWMKDGLPIRGSSEVLIEKHPDGRTVLIVDCAKPDNAGTYQILVSNRLGEATAEGKVTVEKRPVKPEFSKKLQSQTVVEGFPVKFEVKADGYPEPRISWFRNGVEVISDTKHIKITDHPEGVSILLLDAADQARDALTYRAVALNEAGEAETSGILTVKPSTRSDEPEERPLFLHGLRDVLTDEDLPLVIEAGFTGNPIPSVEWMKDNVPLTPTDRILMTCDGRKVGLKIDKALPSDSGIYSVKLINPLGKDSAEGKATVRKIYQPPSFTQKFGDLQQLPERDAKFPCRVTGVPQPEVTWTKDGVPLRETSKFHIKRDGDMCCLYVIDCKPEDAGVYRATATNKEGQDECTGTLEVVKEIKARQKIEPPVFLKRIGDTELFKGMTAKFTACASGIPEPEVEWYHEDKKLFPSTRIKMETDMAGLLRLTISGLDVDDLGKYTCKISNEHGSDICNAVLKFDENEMKSKRPMVDQYIEYDKYKRSGAPMPLSNPPIVSQMTDRHCTLSWKPSIPTGPRFPVTYQLEMCELPNGDWFTARTGIRSCTCEVRNLEPFRDYKFRVRVENKYGISDPSPYAITHREKLEPDLPKWRPYLPPDVEFKPDVSHYFPRDFDIEKPPIDNMAQAPRFLRQEHDTQYGVKDQNSNLFWFVYGYPKPKVSFYFNDELIESGGRFDYSYTRNGQATLFINKMLERDVGWYEAVARNEHGEARQRVKLEIAEVPTFLRRPEVEYITLRGKARFEARIVGVPYPEIKWYKDWKPLATSSRIKIAFNEPDTTILTIYDVIMKDEGLYSVSARNVAGSTSSSAMLHIEENDWEYNMRNYNNPSPIKIRKRLYTDLYDIGDELGRGTQGVTYHAVERLNGRTYGAKVMHGRGDLRPFMYKEFEMMNELHHRKLIGLRDAYETEDSITLILELAAGGELVKDYLLRQDYYTESDIAGFVRQILSGLHYMHERGFGHMGLTLGDLLISHPGGDDLKICDFGLTRRINMARLYNLKYGMPEYVSPECVNGEGVSLAHDMWSLGIITYILLSGRSPFRGANDRETLTNIKSGKWIFEEEWWVNISSEARDFITKLLIYRWEERMDVYKAMKHPWLERADKTYSDEFRISSKYLRDYWSLYREWYDNASCRRWYRRRPLEGAFTDPSKMVYPPGESYTPRATPPPPQEKVPRSRTPWEDQIPTRSPLNYEIGMIKSESHYQNGPDTYLLQLRDVDFPVRLREYMKVASNRGPGSSYIVSDDRGYDWRTPIIRERRRFTDVMDEEIDDERKARINRYGTAESSYSIRRLKHEIGSRLDTYVEAEAFIESKQEGRLPFFREKPQFSAMQEGKDMELTCLAVGDPAPIVQWFKNDAILAESHRIKITTDEIGRSHLKFCPALSFDQGMYKVVARNKIGQTVARSRIVVGLTPDEPDSPEAAQVSDSEILLTWKQPKFDGNSPVLCYRLDYKLADDMEWTKKADNIDHEFYMMRGLQPNKTYLFRLAAKNAIGWSDLGVTSAPISTKDAGVPLIQFSKAMQHLQQITDSGQEVKVEAKIYPDYAIEAKPIEWQYKNPEEEYSFISEISRGRFSEVVKAVNKSTDQIVVAKLMDVSRDHLPEVDGEFAALRSLRHERIASLLAAYKTEENKPAVFILEKLQGADVLTYLASRHEYSEQTVTLIVGQILDGLQYLNWRGLCHLDLQPDNIVMCNIRSIQIKLVDLGSAHRVTKLGTKVPIVGHLQYMSPEIMSEEPAIPQTDIWSVGVLTYVMLSGKLPFSGEDENETRQNILFVRYRFEHLFKEVSQEATRFLMLLFKRHPNKRPTAEECHENRWLLPTDFMIKKRERAVFLGNRLKEYCDEYHNEKAMESEKLVQKLGSKFTRSFSIQEELMTS